MHEKFIHVLRTLANVPTEQAERLVKVARPARLQKGEAFIREGEIPRHFAFVNKGLFRYFYLSEEGKELTKGFFSEGTFLSSYSAMISHRASYFTIEALEDAELLSVDYQQWENVRTQHPAWNELLVAILEKAFIKKEERERQLLLYDAERRYEIFLEQYPGLIHRVNQRQIASYLGITPVALSRTRKKMAALT